MKKKPSEMTDEEVLQAEFLRRFSVWSIPVDKLEEILERQPNEVRQTHYKDLESILEKDAFKREIDDWKRRVGRCLALGISNGKAITELERMGMQIFLIGIEQFEETIRRRAMLVASLKPLRPIHEKI